MKKENLIGIYLPVIVAVFLAIIQLFTTEIKVHIMMLDIPNTIKWLLFATGLVCFVIGRFWALKSKLIALKTFRDKEMVRITNHYNAQLKTFEDRFKILQSRLKEKDIDVDLTGKDNTDPNYLQHKKQDNDTKNTEMKEYNKAFKDWACMEYGDGALSTLYKGENYAVK